MFQLSNNDQTTLLQIARNSVRSHLGVESTKFDDVASDTLSQPYGLFVSIHKSGRLRGCIGNVHPAGPLYLSVSECAVAAAVGDPRFIPLMSDELDLVDFEISVLSPMERVEDMRQIEMGKHGLMITKGKTRGLLLPQVATELGWTREKFLEETCLKAGLGPDEWKNGVAIHCFSALVFGESRPHLMATPLER